MAARNSPIRSMTRHALVASHPFMQRFGVPARVFWVLLLCAGTAMAEDGPIQIELFTEYASFVNRNHPENRIGYRFQEHTPLIHGGVPQSGVGSEAGETSPDLEKLDKRPGRKMFHRHVVEEGWVPQDWTFYLIPVPDGIEMVLVVKTGDRGLPEFYGVQQCFRLTGASNDTWRQKYARTSAFSEFDLWKAETAKAGQASLTWMLRDGSLQQIPAGKEAMGGRTPYGETIDMQRSEGQLENLQEIGPYHARMLWTTDAGLILRTSLDRKWSTGLYWERSTHLSDHHPADCLHAIVNIGGVPPHGQRILRGKIYWLSGPGERIVENWHKDFPDLK